MGSKGHCLAAAAAVPHAQQRQRQNATAAAGSKGHCTQLAQQSKQHANSCSLTAGTDIANAPAHVEQEANSCAPVQPRLLLGRRRLLRLPALEQQLEVGGVGLLQ